MSRRSDRETEAAEREDAAVRQRIAALDARMEAAEAARETRQRNLLAQIRLEREADNLHAAVDDMILAAEAEGSIAPAFATMLKNVTFSSREAAQTAIDAAREGSADLASRNAPTPRPPVVPQPRDNQGRWLPAPAEPQQQPAEVDLGKLSLAEYAALRAELGMDGRGMDNVGRAPGHERSEFMGHQLDDGSGFADWRDYSKNGQVFSSQLADNRRNVPPGYVRRDAESGEQWK
jgi:hypothetical protein